jgi:hypothetical protein
MKTKSHGTAFAHPVAPLMWKSGTCHVSMARVAYVARPAATSRYADAFTAKKSTLATRYSATARPGVPIRTTSRVMMEFGLSTRGRVTPTARQV